MDVRTTTNPKERVIKVRVPDNMSAYLKKVSTICGISVSEYLRKLVEIDMEK